MVLSRLLISSLIVKCAEEDEYILHCYFCPDSDAAAPLLYLSLHLQKVSTFKLPCLSQMYPPFYKFQNDCFCDRGIKSGTQELKRVSLTQSGRKKKPS